MKMQTIKCEQAGLRADVYLSEELGFTRSKIQKMIKSGDITLGGEPIRSRDVTSVGFIYEVTVKDPETLDVKPVDIPLDVVYQDGDLAVINKQQGLTVHQGSGTGDETLVNALLYHLDSLSGINGVIRPGIVHRIDKDTSGLLVVAKNDTAHLSLAKQIEDKTCRREYVALLNGNLKQDSGRIETYISRSTSNRTMMAVSSSGRKAITNFSVIERVSGYTLCRFILETGRTHQIRVHSKYIGHSIVGDTVYGIKNSKLKLNGQLLHAEKLTFVHPTQNREVSFYAPLPEYFKKTIEKLGFSYGK